MTQYTAEEVQQLTKVDRWRLRSCSICGAGLNYIDLQTDAPRYDSNCACTERLTSPQPASWQDIADALNRNPKMQGRWVGQLSGETP